MRAQHDARLRIFAGYHRLPEGSEDDGDGIALVGFVDVHVPHRGRDRGVAHQLLEPSPLEAL